GPIAFVRDGDQITLDVANRLLEVDMGDGTEWENRKVGWEPNPPKYTRGVLGKYAKIVQSAAHGAITG
ncbi:MAG TPA: dihydroxy-acid dehydratase, partial [Acidimicrobiales bacterium]